MGRKKKQKIEEESEQPFCFYCDRVFEHEEVLIQHQKAKHFKCAICNKKLTTAGGLVIHCQQVHKETITVVQGAKEGRESTDFEVFGMEGIPEEFMAERRAQRAAVANGGMPPIDLQPPPMAPPPAFLPFPSFQAPPMGFPQPFLAPPPGFQPGGPSNFPFGGYGAPPPPFTPPMGLLPPRPPPVSHPQTYGMPPQLYQQPPTTASAAPTITAPGVAPPGLTPPAVTVPPTAAVPVQEPAPAAADIAEVNTNLPRLVYAEELESMEERRAMLPRYQVAVNGNV